MCENISEKKKKESPEKVRNVYGKFVYGESNEGILR